MAESSRATARNCDPGYFEGYRQDVGQNSQVSDGDPAGQSGALFRKNEPLVHVTAGSAA